MAQFLPEVRDCLNRRVNLTNRERTANPVVIVAKARVQSHTHSRSMATTDHARRSERKRQIR